MSAETEQGTTIENANLNGALKANVTEGTPPPAYFLSLSVENFRCFKQKQVLNLSNDNDQPARWTLILGDNGVGKTSLLELIALMQPEEISSTNPKNDRLSPKIFNHIIKYEKWFRESFRLEGSASDSEVWGKVVCSISLNNYIHNTTNAHHIKVEAHFSRHGTGASTTLDPSAAGLICYAYGANRRTGTVSLAANQNTDTASSLFHDAVELVNAEEWLLQADYAVSRSKGSERRSAEARFNRVTQVLIGLLPDVEELRITTPPGTTIGAQVQAKTPYGWVPLQNLSLGYRTLLTWMVDLAARLFERYPNSKNPLAEPAIVLVDEIDLHLHPQWQRTLIQFLTDTFPNTQFIATAHSPLVVQSATDANIVLLRREGDHVVIDNDIETIKGWRIDQVLTSDLFGLPSARPPQMDAAMKERTRILGKSRLTKADKAKLAQLEQEIGDLPAGETPADISAMDIIRRAAELKSGSISTQNR